MSRMNQSISSLIASLETNINRVVLGKAEVVRLVVTALLAGEHVLIEDVPGVGKTLIGKSLARSVAGQFARIQFTPDLLPGDITGSSVYRSTSGEFTFVPGPVFANIILADEINRATPRTQSALLEAMSERQVSADGQTFPLPRPFLVIATQNPVEFEGTYPLPESQLDRFLFRLSVGYPDRHAERLVLETHRDGEPVDQLPAVIDCAQVAELQDATCKVAVDASISEYILDISAATRACPDLSVGVSTRGSLALYRAAQARALVAGRDFVVPDDVKSLAVAVLAHRVIPKGYIHGGQRSAVESLIERLVDDIPAPT